MRYYVIALASIALVSVSCSENDVTKANLPEQDDITNLAVCAPEDPVPNPQTCIPEEKATYYADLWKLEFMARNGITEEYFGRHISSIWTSSICWNSGITFTVNYRVKVDWAVIDRCDKIVVMLYSSESAYQHLDIPRDVFLDDRQISRVLDYKVFDSSVGPVVPLESLPYQSCKDAVLAFQDSTQSSDILPTRIAYYVPGKIPREDGYPYFIGWGEVNPSANVCIEGHFNLFTGESEARLTACVIERGTAVSQAR